MQRLTLFFFCLPRTLNQREHPLAHGLVAYLLAADIVSRLPLCRLSGVYQPVIMTRSQFSTPRLPGWPVSERTEPLHTPMLNRILL
jgi:hypothetical protein